LSFGGAKKRMLSAQAYAIAACHGCPPINGIQGPTTKGDCPPR
jgi:hypothetical protein